MNDTQMGDALFLPTSYLGKLDRGLPQEIFLGLHQMTHKDAEWRHGGCYPWECFGVYPRRWRIVSGNHGELAPPRSHSRELWLIDSPPSLSRCLGPSSHICLQGSRTNSSDYAISVERRSNLNVSHLFS